MEGTKKTTKVKKAMDAESGMRKKHKKSSSNVEEFAFNNDGKDDEFNSIYDGKFFLIFKN